MPTYINFIYGNNGTGKSTIASEICADRGIVWQEGKSASDFSVLVYNQAFIDANFQGYGNLKGVFTVGERNIEIQRLVAEKLQQKSERFHEVAEHTKEREQKSITKDSLLSTFQEECWRKAKTIREGFDATQERYKRKAQFADRVLLITSPAPHDFDELKALYETAFDPRARTYREFTPLGGVMRLKDSRGNGMLYNPITSSGDSPFAGFIKALNATDWVRQGHEHFKDTEGKCPYCQQMLPDDFEQELASCFDAQYQIEIAALMQFRDDYAADMQDFINVLSGNLQEVFPKLDLTEYKDKLALFENVVADNLRRIGGKIMEPSSSVTLDNDSARMLREELNALIASFNEKIRANNDVVMTKQKKQAECKTRVWELIAHTLQSEIAAYNKSKANIEAELLALTRKMSEAGTAYRTLENEISELNRQIISTAPTIESINKLIRDSGFQGFILREKRGHPNVYEVIRPNGTVAEKLSEGERNFIAFLYFYHLVRGSHFDTDISKEKIVVIDDPVSSMDSSVLFIVGTLVREMVEVCHNSADYRDNRAEGHYIQQIFVLTHNVYFHREITYNQTPRYDCVSFFVIRKASNISTIKLCERRKAEAPTQMENYNPVQNSYAALWSEYKDVCAAIPLLNVIRRILEYYFMQICGYDGMDIRKRVLEGNRHMFVDGSAEDPADASTDCPPDYTKYHQASAMLSYISASSAVASDGMHYVDDCADVNVYRDTFKLIFEALRQEQHYNMMMGAPE